MTDKYKRYSIIKMKIASLELEANELKPKIVEEIIMLNQEKNGYSNKFGLFQVIPDIKYKYSDDLVAKEKNIKLKIKTMKKDEELTGKAEKVKDGYILKFTGKKD